MYTKPPEGSSQYRPLTPAEEKAVEGLTFRAGEIDHKIERLTNPSNTPNRIQRLFNDAALKSLIKEKTSLVKTMQTLDPILTLSQAAESTELYLGEDAVETTDLLDAKEGERDELLKQRAAIKDELGSKKYTEARLAEGLEKSGFGDDLITPETEATFKEAQKLEATLKGIDLCLAKVGGQIKQFQDHLGIVPATAPTFKPIEKIAQAFRAIHAAVVQKKEQLQQAVLFGTRPFAKSDVREASKFLSAIRKDLNTKNMVDFTKIHSETGFERMQEIVNGTISDKGLQRQRQVILNEFDKKLKNLVNTFIPAKVECNTLREKHPIEIPSLTGENNKNWKDSIDYWSGIIPDFKACENTLGRLPVSFIRVSNKNLSDPTFVEGNSGIEVVRVVHLCNQLKKLILEQWPQADANHVNALVADIVTLMANEHNYTDILSKTMHIRESLRTESERLNSPRTISLDNSLDISKNYSVTLDTFEKVPSCTLTCIRNLEDKDENGTRDKFKIMSTLTRGIDDSSFTGTVVITSN